MACVLISKEKTIKRKYLCQIRNAISIFVSMCHYYTNSMKAMSMQESGLPQHLDSPGPTGSLSEDAPCQIRNLSVLE